MQKHLHILLLIASATSQQSAVRHKMQPKLGGSAIGVHWGPQMGHEGTGGKGLGEKGLGGKGLEHGVGNDE